MRVGFSISTRPLITIVSISPEMESVEAVEKILKYNFRNKSLLKDALTHPSCEDITSYERLEFLGDSAIGNAITNYLFLAYPNLEPHDLTQLRAANVSTEKLARVALIHGLYQFLRRNDRSIDKKVKKFSKAVDKEEDDSVAYGGLVKAPKVLADLVESIAGALYVDVNFDLQRFWVVFRGLFEPIFTLEDMKRQPQPVTMLYELCRKQKKQIDIRNSKERGGIVVGVYLDDEFVASGKAENKDSAKLIACKEALRKLSESMPTQLVIDVDSLEVELEDAKTKLIAICSKKKWPNPIYSLEEDKSSVKGESFVCSVRIKIPTEEGTLYMKGDEHSKKRKAENSSAYHMIRALKKSRYL